MGLQKKAKKKKMEQNLHLTTALHAIQTATLISRSVLFALHSSSSSSEKAEEEKEEKEIHPSLLPYLSSLRSSQELIKAKSDLSPVTVADLAIQTVILQVLSTVFPSHGLVAEESAEQLRADAQLLDCVQSVAVAHARESGFCWGTGGCEKLEEKAAVLEILDRAGAGTGITSQMSRGVEAGEDGAVNRNGNENGNGQEQPFWVVDPIDGTQAFLRGEQYAINVALIKGGRQELSVVACPLLSADVTEGPVTDATVDAHGVGSVMFAARGQGAFVLPLEVDRELDVRKARRLRRYADEVVSTEQLRSVNATRVDSGLRAVHEAVGERLGVEFPGCDLIGWVPRWVALARGLANMTVWVYKRRNRFAKIWDHAGAMLLFEETGGVITDVDGRPINLSRGRLLDANFGFVAAPPQLHSLILAETQQAIRSQGLEHLLAFQELS